MADNGILLESGTNEMELLTFTIGNQPFGVNVAKVQSILQFDPEQVTKLPLGPPALMGMLVHRNSTIPLIDLGEALGTEKLSGEHKRIIIVTEFNKSVNSFLVDSVNRIHRCSWERFVPINSHIVRDEGGIIGSVNIDDREILIVDLERILGGISPDLAMEEASDEVKSESAVPARERIRIFFAEDSKTIQQSVVNAFATVGYTNMKAFDNGLEAFDELNRIAGGGENSLPHVLITDIEMPQMDGLALCRKTREELGLGDLPVIMFSSLINPQMIAKCESVGATSYITKPELNRLIKMIDEFCIS